MKDADDLVDLHAAMVQKFDDFVTDTSESDAEATRDDDYYHGRQWTRDEAAELDLRGQPVTTKNHIFKKLNFLFGNEIQNRTDPRALPRSFGAPDDEANAVTDALRYVADAQRYDSVRSAAWRNILIPGRAAGVVEYDSARQQIVIRKIPWDRFWHDVHSREPDYSDAEHLGIATWWHADKALAFYRQHPHHAADFDEMIENALGEGDDKDDAFQDQPHWVQGSAKKRRLRVVECYYLSYDPATGRPQWMSCHYTRAGFVVEPMPTGYKNELGEDICPLVGTSGIVTRDGERYGLVRHMRDLQDMINKQSSKMLHHLSTDRIIAEESAVRDSEEAKTERAKPDGWVTVQRGALKDGRIQFDKGLDVAQAHYQLLQENKAEINGIGPEIPQIGNTSGDASGRALQYRQHIGNLELEVFHDNLRTFSRSIYERVWYAVRQFWTDEKWLRVTDDAEDTGYRFTAINRRMTRAQRFQELTSKGAQPESALVGVGLPPGLLAEAGQRVAQMAQLAGQQPPPPEQAQQMAMQSLLRHPLMLQPMRVNDVSQLVVDIVLDESPDVAILQQEEFDRLAQFMPSIVQHAPNLAPQALQILIESSQLRNKKRLLQMLKQPPDPQQQQMQQATQQLQIGQMQANVEATKAKAARDQASAQGTLADAQIKQAKAPGEVELTEAKIFSAGLQAAGRAVPL